MNFRQHVPTPLTNLPILLRLRQGNRYIVVVQSTDRTIASKLFWNELQALLATGVSSEFWPYVRTEVLTMVHHNEVPPGTVLFARKNRRGGVLSVVAWSANGIAPLVYASIEEAAAALNVNNA
ncbi:hypothetical protein [Agrobacterium fabrum]|uniref:hypothetical protein n=1 Tax=Agrobacterium fabrum TaxID=1176649 RepID=UPI00273E597E|nr:hypothetical protein [Agrobacterium fabrum]WLP57447.1 hypothetical protein Q8X45_23280 [Agrobacterium fabrum]